MLICRLLSEHPRKKTVKKGLEVGGGGVSRQLLHDSPVQSDSKEAKYQHSSDVETRGVAVISGMWGVNLIFPHRWRSSTQCAASPKTEGGARKSLAVGQTMKMPVKGPYHHAHSMKLEEETRKG